MALGSLIESGFSCASYGNTRSTSSRYIVNSTVRHLKFTKTMLSDVTTKVINADIGLIVEITVPVVGVILRVMVVTSILMCIGRKSQRHKYNKVVPTTTVGADKDGPDRNSISTLGSTSLSKVENSPNKRGRGKLWTRSVDLSPAVASPMRRPKDQLPCQYLLSHQCLLPRQNLLSNHHQRSLILPRQHVHSVQDQHT